MPVITQHMLASLADLLTRPSETWGWNPGSFAAAASLATLLAVGIGLWGAWRQLREATRARFLQAVNEIYRDLDSRKGRAARDYVYWTEPAELTGPEADTGKIRTVANTLEHVGLLAEHSLLAKSIILDYFWELVLEMWSRLKPYVEATREWRGEQYADHFESLAKDAEEYRKRKYPHHRVGTRPTRP